MKAEQIEQTITAIKQHIIEGLYFLYKAAGVGDHRLHLNDSVAHSDGADYQIVAIDMDFSNNQKGEMVYFQVEEEDGWAQVYDEDDDESEFDKQPVEHLPIEVLEKLLAATEKRVNSHYEIEFVLPEIKGV